MKEIKKSKLRKRVTLLYSSVLLIGISYNLGEFFGEQMYLLGFTI